MLRLLRLVRTENHTSGILFQNDDFLAYTLERPWVDNERNISCIPWGWYLCNKHISPRFGETLHVNPVARRAGIIFHGGNTTKDTQGCILLGLDTTWKGTVRRSTDALWVFREKIKDIDKVVLEIKEP